MPGAREIEPESRTPRLYDPENYRAAEILGSRNPAWLVLYGCYSRLIWAFSTFPTIDGRPIVISSRHAGDLAARMSMLQQERRAR